MEATDQTLGYAANFTVVAFKLLVQCLEKNGALLPDQIEAALRETVEHPKAPRDRFDYQLLGELLKQLQGSSGSLH